MSSFLAYEKRNGDLKVICDVEAVLQLMMQVPQIVAVVVEVVLGV